MARNASGKCWGGPYLACPTQGFAMSWTRCESAALNRRAGPEMSGGRSCLADSVESAPGSGIQPRVIRATVQGGRSGGPFNPGPSSAEGVVTRAARRPDMHTEPAQRLQETSAIYTTCTIVLQYMHCIRLYSESGMVNFPGVLALFLRVVFRVEIPLSEEKNCMSTDLRIRFLQFYTVIPLGHNKFRSTVICTKKPAHTIYICDRAGRQKGRYVGS
jgi:hypothetical protein